ncbi:XRE family transcriptional regulator [Volucribacter amazonae]|uniref:HTH cro/C1-type domain-containing protein n=1 Tax=Volucribacter amazonae TaxID=256731 RepID=A0A9X4PBC8_9PAST|nr:LexA family transcriptional regulator [Volucribacter amazonae]MDG6894519.1 hypothetical protein [Volucribacter amazonae]
MPLLPFKQLIKEKRIKLNLAQKEVASLTNITPALISKYENGLSKPRIETAKRIAEVLHIDLETLIKSLEQNETSLIKVPFYLSEDYDSDYFHIADDMLPKHIDSKNLLAYYYKGDAMAPLFQDGDILLIDKSDTKITLNSACLIEIEDYCGVKLVSYNDFAKEYILSSVNENYLPIYMNKGKVNIIGRVIWFSRFL